MCWLQSHPFDGLYYLETSLLNLEIVTKCLVIYHMYMLFIHKVFSLNFDGGGDSKLLVPVGRPEGIKISSGIA